MTEALSLTESQAAILTFIRSQVRKTGRAPTIREIAAQMGYRTNSSVQLHLTSLERAGYLTRERGHRGLQLTDPPAKGLQVAGIVAAGQPVEAIEQNEHLDLTARYDSEEHYLLRVRGDSMIEECIADGDFVVVRRQSTCGNGDLVIARVGEEATLKRFYRENRRIRLQPANASMQPIYCRPADLAIEGVVVGVIRTLD